MKKLFSLLLAAMICVAFSPPVHAQNTQSFHVHDSLVNTSYGGAVDSIWVEAPTVAASTVKMAMPATHRFSAQLLGRCDSISGGFGDSSRVTMELRLLALKYTSTGTVSTVDTNKYNSVVIATGTCAAGGPTKYVNLTTDTNNNFPLGGRLFVLAYSFPGVIQTDVHMDVMYRNKDDD